MFVQSNSAINFDLADKVAMIDFFRVQQIICMPLMAIIQSEVGFLVSLQSDQLVLTQERRDSSNTGQEREYKRPNYTVSAIKRIIILTKAR